MKQTDFLKNLVNKLGETLPENLSVLKKDLEKNFHACLESFFSRLDLVTREEFDTQTRVLARTTEKLHQLEKKIIILEKNQQAQKNPPTQTASSAVDKKKSTRKSSE